MSLTSTNMIPLGFVAPDFNLPDTRNWQDVTFADVKGKHGTVVMFICNHCPFVIHVRETLIKIAAHYQVKGIGFVAISSNDVEQQDEDSPMKMSKLARSLEFPFPYLYDETQEVAHAYKAACTPDFSVFDKNDSCVYRGQLDESRPDGDIPVDGKDLRDVLDALVAGRPYLGEHHASIGCNIKWKPGNEPEVEPYDPDE